MTEQTYNQLFKRMAAVGEKLADAQSGVLIEHPEFAQQLNDLLDQMTQSSIDADMRLPLPPDKGLAQLIGLGSGAAQKLGDTRIPHKVDNYDDHVASERIIAVGDLYYIYQHEKIGVFRVIQKLQELFRSGDVRLSEGEGAYALYQFDRREVLRYTQKDRWGAYNRIFGYGKTVEPERSRPNRDFHGLFTHFINQVTLFWRDKRVSDVIRERANDPSFGSIAIVRRAGLDLRNNLKWTSFGHLNVMRVEVMQLLEEAFKILDADDIKRLFGADSAWDVVEEVLIRYFNERLVTSPRQSMGVNGREIIRWLGQPHILQTERAQFEMLLMQVAVAAEEWLTSAQAMGLAQRNPDERVLTWEQAAPPVGRNLPPRRPTSRPSTPPPVYAAATMGRTNGRRPARESEYEYEY